MTLFRKKCCCNDQIARLDGAISRFAYQNEGLKLGIEKPERKIPEIVRAEIEQLLRNKSLSVVTIYNEQEFLTSIVHDRVKELKHKKRELEEAIIECEKALTTVKGKK